MYNQPRSSAHPDDLPFADPAEMAAPGPFPEREVWQIVVLVVEGRWQPGLLTRWRRLPSGWVAYVRWRKDPLRPAEGWAWFKADPRRMHPLTVEGLEAAGLADEQPEA